jgi:4-hydroxybenzoate polyprenyltransferase
VNASKYAVFFALASLTVGALRVLGAHRQAFQAVSHLWVGFLIGGAVYSAAGRRSFVWQAVALSVVETLCFLFGSFAVVSTRF